MKIIVIYDSYTGNTKAVAKAVAKGLYCKAIHIDNFNKYKIKNYDLIVIGTPVHAGRPSGKVKKILNKEKTGAHYAFFCTYGAYIIGKPSAESCLNYMKKKISTKCLGEFSCPASTVFKNVQKQAE